MEYVVTCTKSDFKVRVDNANEVDIDQDDQSKRVSTAIRVSALTTTHIHVVSLTASKSAYIYVAK